MSSAKPTFDDVREQAENMSINDWTLFANRFKIKSKKVTNSILGTWFKITSSGLDFIDFDGFRRLLDMTADGFFAGNPLLETHEQK
jgi:hypothetical protein